MMGCENLGKKFLLLKDLPKLGLLFDGGVKIMVKLSLSLFCNNITRTSPENRQKLLGMLKERGYCIFKNYKYMLVERGFCKC